MTMKAPSVPRAGRYSLALQYDERYAGPYSDPDTEQFRKPEHLAAWLEEVEVDLVTLWPEEARALGERGVLLPLERFSGVEGSDIEREFFSPQLDAFRENGALYALPVGADPLMLYYDVDYFAQAGVAPPDNSWDWDILVENALRLNTARGGRHRETLGTGSTQREYLVGPVAERSGDGGCADIAVPAAGTGRHRSIGVLSRTDTYPPRLPSGIQYGFIGTHSRSKGCAARDVVHDWTSGFSRFNYRSAELPRGKVRSVPVRTDPGIAIVAQTAKPEVAYRALRGLLKAMQPHVGVPSEREAVARLGQFRSDLQPQEVAAIQQSMEYGRAEPDDAARRRAIYYMAEALVRGDSVASRST